MALFEFYSYGMYASGMPETQNLMCGLIQVGAERGFRQYQHENTPTYREVSASMTMEYSNEMLWANYFRQVRNNLPDKPDQFVEMVMKLHQERKIPYDKANQWIGESMQSVEKE